MTELSVGKETERAPRKKQSQPRDFLVLGTIGVLVLIVLWFLFNLPRIEQAAANDALKSGAMRGDTVAVLTALRQRKFPPEVLDAALARAVNQCRGNACSSMIEALLAAGASPNAVDPEGSMTLGKRVVKPPILVLALLQGQLQNYRSLLLLVQHGATIKGIALKAGVPEADIQSLVADYISPIGLTREAMTALLDAGSDPNAVRSDGDMVVSQFQETEADRLELYLDRGADLRKLKESRRYFMSRTAMLVARAGNVVLLRKMIKAGVDTQNPELPGLITQPQQIRKNRAEVIAVLKAAGVKP